MLAGCGGLIGSYLGTQQALRDAGFQSVSVHFHFARSGDRVNANVAVAAPPSDTDVRDVASVVWDHVHQTFRLLTVTVRGTGSGAGQVRTGVFTFAQLESTFGARKTSWNQNTLTEAAEHLGYTVLAGILGLIVVITVVATLLVRRRRRRRALAAGVDLGAPLACPCGLRRPGRLQ